MPMIKLRSGTAAFLKNGGDVLLLKRSQGKKIAPGMWSGVGGHMERHELDNPLATCYREVEEESGIVRDDIHGLALLYVIVRKVKDYEIRQSYIYFGETTRRDVVQTDEGELHWVPESELLNREYTQSFTAMLRHYSARDPQDTAVYVGVAGNDNGKLAMTWTRCEDFEQLPEK